MDCIRSNLMGDDNPEVLNTVGKFIPPSISRDTWKETAARKRN
jgi:hypothetical protein